MPYLNWKTGAIREQEIGTHPKRGSLLRMAVSAEKLAPLAEALEETFLESAGEPARELRTELPREWLLFWKKREGESRLLLAHPEPDVWVATVALEDAHAQTLISLMKTARPGTTLTLGEHGSLGEVSNVEVVISVV